MAPSASFAERPDLRDPKVGNEHGYYDSWVEDVFHYTGWGKRGDQSMKAGNRAVLHHVGEGRAVRLFRGVGGNVTYIRLST